MKILHVLDHSIPLFSGYSFRSRSIVRFQQRLGLDPIVLTSPKHGSADDVVETIEDVRYYRTRAARRRVPVAEQLGLMLRLTARIIKVARVERPRILHAHSPVLNGLPALWAGRRLGIPVVYEARAFWEDAAVDHGTAREGSLRYRVSRALESSLFRRADRVVTICEGMRREIVERGVPAGRVVAVPNGVDVEWFQPRPPDAELGKSLGLNGGPVFGFIGSFYRYEGLRFLLDAVARLRQRLPGAHLLLVGGGEDAAEVKAAAGRLGNAVIFPGQVAHDRVRDFYSVIDVFVCPRRRMRLTELTTPLKPLEAMAMGRPVIGSDVGGLAELIEDGVTGLLFRAESTESFVDAAGRLGDDPGLRNRLGRQARDYMLRERAWHHVVPRYLSLYQALA